MKQIILCADDYGQTCKISQAIIDLIKRGRLTATSCMVTSPDWQQSAAWLMPYKNIIDIGLHFNLTEGKKVSLSSLLIKSHLCLLNKKAIRKEFNAQLDQFVDTMGVLPDFVDGHQHVHQFPQIREVLLEVYEERLRKYGCYIRCIYDPDFKWNLKSFILQCSGAMALKKQLTARNIPHNSSFSGVYGFDADSYGSLFLVFLTKLKQAGLMMCHPGLDDLDNKNDEIHEARAKEYAFLNSEHCSRILEEAQVNLVRFKNLR